jgi:hypothetical protein
MSDFGALLSELCGQWSGHCQLFLDPEKEAERTELHSTFTKGFTPNSLRHRYEGFAIAKPRQGEEWIAWNGVTGNAEVAWIDSFHMNYAILWSIGTADADGYNVVGKYDVAVDSPPWGWRTKLLRLSHDELEYRVFNIDPDGNEMRAIITNMRRTS